MHACTSLMATVPLPSQSPTQTAETEAGAVLQSPTAAATMSQRANLSNITLRAHGSFAEGVIAVVGSGSQRVTQAQSSSVLAT